MTSSSPPPDFTGRVVGVFEVVDRAGSKLSRGFVVGFVVAGFVGVFCVWVSGAVGVREVTPDVRVPGTS
ncbi:hypothetical protein [Corallococcus sp. CA053C]|uniref:hypothetical protein n=1 Tax=Corallococcus sp. CA053C TaxID=2316732 RepID=UPI0011C389BE|nr:hypothetical protein [Corallococcus sp. CA053C]